MPDDTTILTKSKTDSTGESKVLGVSVRGWMAVCVLTTICLSSVLHVSTVAWLAINQGSLDAWATYDHRGPVFEIGLTIVAFFFGQASKQAPQTQTKP